MDDDDATDPEMPQLEPIPRGKPALMFQPPKALPAEELAKMSKMERRAYYESRLQPRGAPAAATRSERRTAQETQRRAKLEKAAQGESSAPQSKGPFGSGPCVPDWADDEADLEAPEEEESGDVDLHQVVKDWMQRSSLGGGRKEPAAVESEELEDLVCTVRLSGLAPSGSDLLLAAVLDCGAEECRSLFDPGDDAIEPSLAMKRVKPWFQRWCSFLEHLSSEAPTTGLEEALGAAVERIFFGNESGSALAKRHERVAVGFLMCARDTFEELEDEKLARACRSLGLEGPVMSKFLVFLEDNSDDSEDA